MIPSGDVIAILLLLAIAQKVVPLQARPFQLAVSGKALAVQVAPLSVDVAAVCPPLAIAQKVVPLEAIQPQFPYREFTTGKLLPVVQLIPSVDVIDKFEFDVITVNRVPAVAIATQLPVTGKVCAVQVMPSVEVR